MEVRKYEPYLIAETTVDESSMRKAGGAGFGKCAGYIFDKNRPRTKGGTDGKKMATTAPVVVRSVGEDDVAGKKMAMTSPARSLGKMSGRNKTKVLFVIESKYYLKSVPQPLDKSVTVKGHYLAARSFAGPPPSDKIIRKEREAIVQTLQMEGIQVKNEEEMIVYGYHDPVITPNFLRKNEVAVIVDGSSLN